MAGLNASYGSELHLLRMLGRHRDYLNCKVLKATTADEVEWLDFPSGDKHVEADGRIRWDREWGRLNFLPKDDPARREFDNVWPARGTGHNWDAVARLRFGSIREWLLVEAKGNIEELESKCNAKDNSSIELINKAFSSVKTALGAAEPSDWTRPYYQHCNRLAVLHIMNCIGTPARLLLIYFCGDGGDTKKTFPQSKQEWQQALLEQDSHVGLASDHHLVDRIHKLFVDVRCT